jgi:hypothetical protein
VPYVTGAQNLQHVAGSGAPSTDADDVAWAGKCADAVEGAIAHRLGDGAFTPSASQSDMLEAAALQDGAALYVARKAPHGVLSVTPDGDVARLGSSILRACESILYPINPGIG